MGPLGATTHPHFRPHPRPHFDQTLTRWRNGEKGGEAPFRPARNDHKAGSSSGPKRERQRVNFDHAHWLWEHNDPVPWPDVKLTEQWHLIGHRVPIPSVPPYGPSRRREIMQRRTFLPFDLRDDPTIDFNNGHWDRWFGADAVPDMHRRT